VLLMLPLNVMMVAKIRGTVNVEQLAAVLDSLRKRYALLAVRVVIDNNDIAWYVAEDVPEFTINTIPRNAQDQWLQTVVEECKTSLPIETGPLIRFSLLHSPERSDLVICAHHAICDGMSLTYLIRDILRDTASYRASAGLAVSTRDKLNVPVGEAFGFYASSLTAHLEYDPHRTFWDSARIFHEKIGNSLAKTNIFRSLSAELLAPTLLDSLYFSKYGLMKSRLSDMLVKQMNWQGVSYGYAITNVGRMNIPTNYAQYQLESVYGPFVYSDVNEKTMGVITVGHKVTFLVSYNEAIVTSHTAEAIRDTAMDYISNAVDS
jgi:NRPS condensation-like uncharacterized protein